MKDQKPVVSLITPTDPCRQIGDLAEGLEELGYCPQIISVRADKIVDVINDHFQILFLANCEGVIKLLPQLQDWPSTSRLAVIPQGVSWERKILDYCSEVMSWPCSQSELLFRLKRAFSQNDDQVNDALFEVSVELNLIGRAPSFLRTLAVIRRIAKYKATVLIRGETGTGKEIAARAIHYLGNCSDGPFVPVNCGGIPPELFENELFGHIRGAYTDAKGKQCGYVEQAEGGTLFLDEIDSLSLNSQATLLRLLQDQIYKPLGSGMPKRANIRIIAATNADLGAEVEAHRFRQDLLFRLDVLSVELPSLRDRPGDEICLAEYFTKKFCREYGCAPRLLHSDFLTWIKNYSWPGNIRELENTILRGFLLSEGKFIVHCDKYADEPSGRMAFSSFNEEKARAINEFERQYLERVLIEAHGNISFAAKLAGKERRALGKLLQKHGINRIDYVLGRS